MKVSELLRVLNVIPNPDEVNITIMFAHNMPGHNMRQEEHMRTSEGILAHSILSNRERIMITNYNMKGSSHD